MIRDRLKRGARRLKRGLTKRLFNEDDHVHTAEMSQAVHSPVATPKVSPLAPEPVAVEVAPEPVATEPAEDVIGPPMTLETVAALFEDMVRPALQSDGGDIDLVKVENDEVHVRLTGACSTCPSSTVTMKMGIERLLVEEFPTFRNLIQVHEPL